MFIFWVYFLIADAVWNIFEIMVNQLSELFGYLFHVFCSFIVLLILLFFFYFLNLCFFFSIWNEGIRQDQGRGNVLSHTSTLTRQGLPGSQHGCLFWGPHVRVACKSHGMISNVCSWHGNGCFVIYTKYLLSLNSLLSTLFSGLMFDDPSPSSLTPQHLYHSALNYILFCALFSLLDMYASCFPKGTMDSWRGHDQNAWYRTEFTKLMLKKVSTHWWTDLLKQTLILSDASK